MSDIHSLLNIKLVRLIFLNEYVQFKKYETGTIKWCLMNLLHFLPFFYTMSQNKYASRCRMSQRLTCGQCLIKGNLARLGGKSWKRILRTSSPQQTSRTSREVEPFGKPSSCLDNIPIPQHLSK